MLALACSLLTASGYAPSSNAAEPELVGVLALALEDEISKELRLTVSQREALLEVIDEREMAGIRFAIAAKDLPRTERLKKLAPFREESVRLGLEILTDQQRELLAELQAASDEPAYAAASPEEASPAEPRHGETSPSETDSAESKDRDTSADNATPPTESAPAAETATSKEPAETKTTETKDQAAPTASEAQPSAPQSFVPKSSAPEEPPATEVAETGVVEQVAPAVAPTPETDGEVRLSFNFRYQPWQDVLDWLAEQADLSLVLESPPPGTFNYQDSRIYDIGQALDIINSVLQTKGYTLVRKGRMLLLVNLEDGVPPNMVTDVP
ncbi:MAG: hypothetical protein AAF589_05725, partial [Planctomycetota bacterium]